MRRRRSARSHFTSMTLLANEERRVDWVLGLMLPPAVIDLLKSGADRVAATFEEASVLFIKAGILGTEALRASIGFGASDFGLWFYYFRVPHSEFWAVKLQRTGCVVEASEYRT